MKMHVLPSEGWASHLTLLHMKRTSVTRPVTVHFKVTEAVPLVIMTSGPVTDTNTLDLSSAKSTRVKFVQSTRDITIQLFFLLEG